MGAGTIYPRATSATDCHRYTGSSSRQRLIVLSRTSHATSLLPEVPERREGRGARTGFVELRKRIVDAFFVQFACEYSDQANIRRLRMTANSLRFQPEGCPDLISCAKVTTRKPLSVALGAFLREANDRGPPNAKQADRGAHSRLQHLGGDQRNVIRLALFPDVLSHLVNDASADGRRRVMLNAG